MGTRAKIENTQRNAREIMLITDIGILLILDT